MGRRCLKGHTPEHTTEATHANAVQTELRDVVFEKQASEVICDSHRGDAVETTSSGVGV